jgi:hypothetical protein
MNKQVQYTCLKEWHRQKAGYPGRPIWAGVICVARSRQVCMYLVVETLLNVLPYSNVASDLSTQCLSRQ